MSDPRLDSAHLGFLPRRQEYRRARDALLGTRGWLTLAAEQVHDLVGDVQDWSSLLPVRPQQVLLGTIYLLVDQQAGACYPLKTGLNTIGRLPNNDIVLEEYFISRRHCVILVHAWRGCVLHDTASRNGTHVNGQRFRQPVRLTSGDWIQICSKKLLFVSEEDYQAVCEIDEHPETAPG